MGFAFFLLYIGFRLARGKHGQIPNTLYCNIAVGILTELRSDTWTKPRLYFRSRYGYAGGNKIGLEL